MNELTWNAAQTKATENKGVLEIVGTFLRDKKLYKPHGKKLPPAFVP